MGQYYDFFVCPLPIVERRADALQEGDEELQEAIEAEMDCVVPLKNVGHDEFCMLARSTRGDVVDLVNAVEGSELVRAVSEEGPWVTALHRSAVEAVAGAVVGPPLIERWVKAAAGFHGDEDRYRGLLDTEIAESLKDVSALAVSKGLDVFVCFYG